MIRLTFVTLAALGLQLAAAWSHDVSLTKAVMFGTYPLLAIVALANWRLPGLHLFLAGVLLNFAALAANGGLMPVASTTLASVNGQEAALNVDGAEAIPGSKSVVIPDEDIALGALADRIVINLPIVGVKIVSVGDLLIGLGISLAICQVLATSKGPMISTNRSRGSS